MGWLSLKGSLVQKTNHFRTKDMLGARWRNFFICWFSPPLSQKVGCVLRCKSAAKRSRCWRIWRWSQRQPWPCGCAWRVPRCGAGGGDAQIEGANGRGLSLMGGSWGGGEQRGGGRGLNVEQKSGDPGIEVTFGHFCTRPPIW